jgi:DNA-binding response OmpR family regulator
MKILIIEDEQTLQKNIAEYFSREKITCDLASTYQTAYDKLLDRRYDCILLDIGLPGGNGLDLLKEIKREKREDGIIIISAKDAVEDKITGLDVGADDYMTKPFHLSELSARIKSVVRRKQYNGQTYLSFNELKVRMKDRQCFVNDRQLPLSKKESDLLLFLVANKNRLVTKAAIMDHLAKDINGYCNNNDLVYTHIKNLKKKLQEAGCTDRIKTIHGLGYKFEWHEAAI